LTELYDQAEQSQRLIVDAEDARPIALILLNMFVVNTSALFTLSAMIEAGSDETLKTNANLVGDYVERQSEDIEKRVDLFAFLSEVPAAGELLEELDEFDGDDVHG
jgi:hypothetical protein